jgi:acyl-CoA thioesterase
VGHFERDTDVRREGGVLRATLSPDWEVWGPLGGYVAAVALRALGASTDLRRPAIFACTFLSVARFGDVDLHVRTLRRGKRSHALQVDMTQEGSPILSALGWAVSDGMSGLAHAHGAAPHDEWLLCDAHAPVGSDGLLGCTGRVWSPGGALLASGTSTLFCRPNPNPR